MKGFTERLLARERASRKEKIRGQDSQEQDKQRIEESWPPLKPLPQHKLASEDVETNPTDTSNPPTRLITSHPPRVPLESSNQSASTQLAPDPKHQHKHRRHSEDGHVNQGPELEASTSSEPTSKATNGDVTDPRVVVRRRSLDHKQVKSPPKLRTNSAEPRRNVSAAKILDSERNNSILDELRHELESSRHEIQAHEREIEDLKESLREKYEAMVFEKNRAEKQHGQIRSLKQGKADLETQYANAKKERDNLKKHLGAMTQAYKARGLNYDDFAKMDHLREEVAHLGAENTNLATKLSKASEERDQATAHCRELLTQLEQIHMELQRLRESSQQELEATRVDLELEAVDIQQKYQADIRQMQLQHKNTVAKLKDHIYGLEKEHHSMLVDKEERYNDLQDENAQLKAFKKSAEEAQNAAIQKTLAMTGEQLNRVLQITYSTFEQQRDTLLRTMKTSIEEANATLAAELREDSEKQQEVQK